MRVAFVHIPKRQCKASHWPKTKPNVTHMSYRRSEGNTSGDFWLLARFARSVTWNLDSRAKSFLKDLYLDEKFVTCFVACVAVVNTVWRDPRKVSFGISILLLGAQLSCPSNGWSFMQPGLTLKWHSNGKSKRRTLNFNEIPAFCSQGKAAKNRPWQSVWKP